MNETAHKIVDLAEEAIAAKGYSSFSFRELAAQLGIKSASVHYHFPAKADLGLAVATRYRERYRQALEQIAADSRTAAEALEALVAIYRQEVHASQRMSLCTMLAAEMQQLPASIQEELQAFYRLNLDWLESMLARRQPPLPPEARQARAAQLLAMLQGGLTGAKIQRDPAYFDAVVGAQAFSPDD